MPEARHRIREYNQIITLVRKDLCSYVWQGGPIKILLIDAMKNWELAQSIATSFIPFLAEQSILIHQDFKHWDTPWIHILQYRLRDYFSFKHEVADGGTVAFTTHRSIPAEVVVRASQFGDVSDTEIEEAFTYSIGLVADAGKSAVAAAHLMYFVHRGRAQMAREVLARYSAAHLLPTNAFSIAKENVESMPA